MHPLRTLPFPLLVIFLPLAVASCGAGEEPAGPQHPAASAASAGRVPSAGGAASGADAAEQLYQLGQRAAVLGKVEEAIADYRRALELDPDHVEARFALGRALVPASYSPALGSSTRDFGVLDEALGYLEGALAERPEDPTYQYWTGRALDLRGRDDEAIACLRKATELDPDYGAAHKRLGLVYVEAGEIDAAKLAFERALETLPEDPGVCFQLGNLYLEEDPGHARDLYRKGIEIDPYFPWCYNGLAQALAGLGDVEGAKAAKAKLEEMQALQAQVEARAKKASANPSDADAQVRAAEAFQAVGKNEEALEMYRRALEVDPENAAVYYACGLIMEEWENWDAAMDHFEEALYLSPADLPSRVELIRVASILGNEARAEELAEGLADVVRGMDVASREAAAEVLLGTSRKEEGVALLRAILEADPGDPVATELLKRAEG